MPDNPMTTPPPLAAADMKELRRLLDEASPGPWRLGRLGDAEMSHVVDMGPPPESPFMVLRNADTIGPAYGVAHSDDGSSEANAALIVAAVNALPSLLAEREARETTWQPIDTAPNDGSPILAVGRFANATAGYPRIVHFMQGQWREPGRGFGEPLICWAWQPRPTVWPSETEHMR